MILRLANGPNVASYPPGATFGPRILRDWEFVWILEGHANYWFSALDDGPKTEIELREGDLILCRQNTRDGFEWDAKNRTRHGFFHFSLLEKPASWPEIEDWPLHTRLEGDSILEPLCRSLITWGNTGDEAQNHLVAAVVLGAFVTGQTSVGQCFPRRLPEPVERGLNFLYRQLETDASAPIPLEKLARAAFVTPEHLCRLFKTSTGHSPLETVRLARLDRAAMLLARSNFSIAEVARLTGFASPFHFSRAFKEAYGRSPRAFVQAIAKGETPEAPRLLQTLRAP